MPKIDQKFVVSSVVAGVVLAAAMHFVINPILAKQKPLVS